MQWESNNTPFFFSDEIFLKEVEDWKKLFFKTINASDILKLSKNEEFSDDELYRINEFYKDVLSANILFSEMVNRILDVIINDGTLCIEYDSPNIDTSDIVGTQIFQYIFPNSSFEKSHSLLEENKVVVSEVLNKI